MYRLKLTSLGAFIMLLLWLSPFAASANASPQGSPTAKLASDVTHGSKHHGRRQKAAAKCHKHHSKRKAHKTGKHSKTHCIKRHSKRHLSGAKLHGGAKHDSTLLVKHHRSSVKRLSGRRADNAGYSTPPPAPSAEGGCSDSYLAPAPGDLERVRQATLCLINEEREAHGEHGLQLNSKLENAAQAHTEDMVEHDYFEHIAPDGSTPLIRFKESGYIHDSRDGYSIGENIAWGTLQLATPKAIVDAWMNSPGHRANILNAQFKETAIGVVPNVPSALDKSQAGAIYTQDFGVIITA